MNLIFISATIACILLALHSKSICVLQSLCQLMHIPAWRVETMYMTVVKGLFSAISTLILMRMLSLVMRLAWGVFGHSRARQNKPRPSEILLYVYPRVRFYQGVLPSNCVICLCEGNNTNAVLECGHAFHWACIRPWLDARNTCPLCMRTQARRAVDAMGRLVADNK